MKSGCILAGVKGTCKGQCEKLSATCCFVTSSLVLLEKQNVNFGAKFCRCSWPLNRSLNCESPLICISSSVNMYSTVDVFSLPCDFFNICLFSSLLYYKNTV